MNLFADESVDKPIVERLRQASHDVVYVAELAPSITDDEVLREANGRSAVLVTADKDFGELVVRLGLPAFGVVLVRMNPADSAAKLSRLREVLQHHAARLAGSFVVVDESKTRFRPLH